MNKISTKLPTMMLGPDLYPLTRIVEQNPTAAVIEALRKMEDLVRRLSESERISVGAKLMGNAFGKAINIGLIEALSMNLMDGHRCIMGGLLQFEIR